VDADTFFWLLARVCGLAAFAALSISLLTGIALRTAVLDWLGSSRALRGLHEYTTILWMPLAGLHVLSLLLDQTARIGPVDLIVPFLVPYARVAAGLGTTSFQILLLVAVTGWARRRITVNAWQWVHRLSYLAFAMLFLHGALGGTDFNDPLVSALTWSTSILLALLGLARLIWGRLPA
jgi:predicted ferric reductase